MQENAIIAHIMKCKSVIQLPPPPPLPTVCDDAKGKVPTYDTCATYIEKGKKREEINRRIKLHIWSRMQNANGHGTAQTECNTIESIAIFD